MIKALIRMYAEAGGWKFAFGTPYIYISAFLTFLFYDWSGHNNWADLAIGMFPSLVGFSLASFAIVLALFGADRLAKLSIPRVPGQVSPLTKLTTIIVHTAATQVIALSLAFASKQKGLCEVKEICGYQNFIYEVCRHTTFSAIVNVSGMFLTVYGMMLILSTLITMFQTSELIGPR